MEQRAAATTEPRIPSSMNAWTTSGDGIDAVRRTTVDVPQPGEREILVEVTARSLNYRDLLVIGGRDHWRPSAPVIPISDGVGTVVAAGRQVTRFRVGDRASATFLPHWRTGPLTEATYTDPVGGPTNRGTLTDYMVIDQDEAVVPPASLTDPEAATLPVAGLTAWHAVAERGAVGPGQTVLVHGTGGVALFAAQFARALGASVAVTSSRARKLERARELGAACTVDYRRQDVAAAVLAWTGGRGVDHIVETVGGDNLNTSLRAVALGGSISFIGLMAGRTAPVNTYEFVTRNVTIHGIETGSRDMYERMSTFIDAHRIRPAIEHVGTAEDLPGALRQLERGGHFGKLVLT